jgi:hypothetical protein
MASTSSGNVGNSSSGEWVELTDPQTGRLCYANPVSGECRWDRPANVRLYEFASLSTMLTPTL